MNGVSFSSAVSIRRLVMAAGAAAALAAVPAAHASFSISPTFLTVRAQVGPSVGTYTVPTGSVNIEDLDLDGNNDFYWFESLVAIPVYEGVNQNSGNIVAQVARISASAQQFNYDLDSDTVVDLSYWVLSMDFLVTGGNGVTQFDIFSPLASIGPAGDPLVSSSATLFGQDIYEVGNNVTVQPMLSSGFGFESDYNGSTMFRQYFDQTLSSSTNAGASGNMAPPDSFESVAQPISDMSFKYSFSVSQWDDAGGTAFFGVVPAPASATLLGLAALGLVRRRR